MTHDAKLRQYELSAEREDEAAARAATRESARLHRALADMYRQEATRLVAPRQVMRLAYD